MTVHESHSKMAAIVKRLPAATLRDWIKAGKSVAVIDVREDDHVGGNIVGSHHYPAYKLADAMPEVIKTVADKEAVGQLNLILSMHEELIL